MRYLGAILVFEKFFVFTRRYGYFFRSMPCNNSKIIWVIAIYWTSICKYGFEVWKLKMENRTASFRMVFQKISYWWSIKYSTGYYRQYVAFYCHIHMKFMFYPPLEKSSHGWNISPVLIVKLFPVFIFCHVYKKKFV